MAQKAKTKPLRRSKSSSRALVAKRDRHITLGGIADGDSPLVHWLSGGPAASGINVDENVALSMTAVFCAVRRISQSVARLPLHTLFRGENGIQRKAKEHGNYRLLWLQPNQLQTAFEFWELMIVNLLVRGNAFAELQRDMSGKPIALWWLRADRVRIVMLDGEPFYAYTYPDGYQAVFDRDHVLHIPGFSLNGLVGMNTIQVMKESLGLTAALEAFASLFFGNGANTSGWIEFPNKLDDDVKALIRKQIEDNYGSIRNSHRTMVLDQGMKWNQRGISPEDAQALQSRTFQVTEVARIWDIPPHMLAELTRSTNNNIEQQSLEFVLYGLGPIVARLEPRIMISMFDAKELDAGYYVKFSMDALLRGDSAARAAFYQAMWQMGALSQDEIREKEDMPPLPDGAGAKTWVPVNYMPAAIAAKGQNIQINPGAPGKAQFAFAPYGETVQ